MSHNKTFDADQLALETAKAIGRIDPDKLPGGVNQAMAQAQCLILDAIQAATEQHTPKGWKLVPIEPTNEIKSAMRNAVDAAYLAKLEGIGGEASDWALQSYRAALLATQEPDDWGCTQHKGVV